MQFPNENVNLCMIKQCPPLLYTLHSLKPIFLSLIRTYFLQRKLTFLMEHEYFRNFSLSPFLIYEDVRSQTKVKQFVIYFLTSERHIFSGSPFSHCSAMTLPPASCTIPHCLLICLDSSYISSGREGGRYGGGGGTNVIRTDDTIYNFDCGSQ